MSDIYDLSMNLAVVVFLLGCVVLDAVFGDPRDWPHPTRLIGMLLARLEGPARAFFLGPRLGGCAVVLLLMFSCAVAVKCVTSLPLVGELAALYLGYAGLALGCLVREVNRVIFLVDGGRLPEARAHLAGLVSRDTSDMDEENICRALGETLSENFNDGFVTPFFWLSLLGPAALWAYKAVSTMDSMWGYRTDRFRELGFGGARTDDLLAWIPARLSAVFLWSAGLVLLRPARWKLIVRDARTMDSPNAGWPMSAAAHIVGVPMGGPTRYFGEIKDKPLLGPEGRPWTTDSIRTMCRVIITAAVLCAGSLAALGGWLSWWSIV
jgi:adenosylcobinamide-phosphate synthase